MGFFDKYPYTSNSEINLDFMLGEIRRLSGLYNSIEKVVEEIKREVDDINSNIDDAVRDYFSALTLNQLEQIVVGALGEQSQIAFLSSGLDDDNANRLSACIVVSCLNHAVLIDVGNEPSANILLTYLSNIGVDTIDAVIITHWHSDHINGLDGLKAQNTIDLSGSVLYIPHGGVDPNEVIGYNDTNWVAYISRESANKTWWTNNADGYYSPTEGENVYINGIEYTFNNVDGQIYSDFNYYTYCKNEMGEDTTETNYNDFSMVVSLRYGESFAVMTGDIEYPATEAMAGVVAKADLLQINHHGLNSYDGEAYLTGISAKYSVACCYGARFQSGFRWCRPTIERCHEVGAVFATDEESIIFGFSPLGFTTNNYPKLMTLNANPLAVGMHIIKNMDLDNLTTPGVYSCQNNEITQTLSNAPDFTSGFKLYVAQGSEGGALQQIAITLNNIHPVVAIRNYYSGSFQNWDYYNGGFKMNATNPNDFLDNADIEITNANYNLFKAYSGMLSITFGIKCNNDIPADSTIFTFPNLSLMYNAFLVSSLNGEIELMRVTTSGGNSYIKNLTALDTGKTYIGHAILYKAG